MMGITTHRVVPIDFRDHNFKRPIKPGDLVKVYIRDAVSTEEYMLLFTKGYDAPFEVIKAYVVHPQSIVTVPEGADGYRCSVSQRSHGPRAI